jgi:predicted unusual protein kinase regulating ubiquinone biosynthesis (AarF/ABC1/UbiB family)
MTKEDYAKLEKLIDNMLEKSLTDEDYQEAEQQLNDCIRNFYVQKEKQKKAKIEQARTAAVEKICDGIADFMETVEEFEMDPEYKAEFKQALQTDVKTGLNELVKSFSGLAKISKILEKEDNRLKPEYEEVQIRKRDGSSDPLMEYINTLLERK